MKRCYIAVLCCAILGACNVLETDEDLKLINEDNYGEALISSSDMDGVWMSVRQNVLIENGEIKPDYSYANSLPYFGELTTYLEFDNGDLCARYFHYRFYEPKTDEVYCEYVVDYDVSSTFFTFDKKKRKGECKGLDETEGTLLLLESNPSEVRLLLLEAEGDHEVMTLRKEEDQQLIDKLKTWENRNQTQMWEDCRKYWDERGE